MTEEQKIEAMAKAAVEKMREANPDFKKWEDAGSWERDQMLSVMKAAYNALNATKE